jgi:hypothetical protein
MSEHLPNLLTCTRMKSMHELHLYPQHNTLLKNTRAFGIALSFQKYFHIHCSFAIGRYDSLEIDTPI